MLRFPEKDEVRLWERVEVRANDFENAWKNGRRPAVRDYLHDFAEAERLVVVEELIKLDLAYRVRAGEPASPDDYLAEFPELQALPSVRLKALGPDAAVSPTSTTAPHAGPGP